MGNVVFIGVDPGDVTGIACWTGEQWQTWEVPAESVSTRLQVMISHYGAKNVRIGCEQYVERGNQRKTHQPLAQRITGAVQALDSHTYLIAPATAKRMCNDSRLKKLGWYSKTKDGHSNDASRILFATVALTSPGRLKDLLDLG